MLVVGLLALGVTGCQKPDDIAPPRQLLPRDKMVRLLVELHTLEARTDASALPSDSARALFRQEQKRLYTRYQTTDSAFQQSYQYYAIHDKDLDEIYATVIDSLTQQEKRQDKSGTSATSPTRRN
ncbi:hypothetical protein GCM10027346_30180 [Hymenobacter seoulensis]